MQAMASGLLMMDAVVVKNTSSRRASTLSRTASRAGPKLHESVRLCL